MTRVAVLEEEPRKGTTMLTISHTWTLQCSTFLVPDKDPNQKTIPNPKRNYIGGSRYVLVHNPEP